MKVRSGPNARIMTQMVTHYRHAVHQHAGDTGTMPAFGIGRDIHVNMNIHIPTPTETARKSKLVKSDGRIVRRVSYR